MGKVQISDLGIGILSRESLSILPLRTYILVAICSSLAPLDNKELMNRATLTKVDHSGRTLYGHNGGVWEWTTTPLAGYPGYVPSELYPGYSADFFDDKHFVVVGPLPTPPLPHSPSLPYSTISLDENTQEREKERDMQNRGMRTKLIIRSEDLTLLSPLSPVGKHSETGIRQITHTPSLGVGSSSTSKPEYEPMHESISVKCQCLKVGV